MARLHQAQGLLLELRRLRRLRLRHLGSPEHMLSQAIKCMGRNSNSTAAAKIIEEPDLIGSTDRVTTHTPFGVRARVGQACPPPTMAN